MNKLKGFEVYSIELMVKTMKTRKALNLAEREYTERICMLFPANSRWMCTYGSPYRSNGYEVEVKGFVFDKGILVENVGTHKRKYVHWAYLHKPYELDLAAI